MTIALGCDHGGYALKEKIKIYLESKGVEYEDFGCFSSESCDYPVYARQAAQAVADGRCERGVVVCTTGIGVSMAANKVRGVRCALCHESWSAQMTRRHNNANVLALGAAVTGEGLALEILEQFLTADFEGGRHARRVEQIED